MVWTTSKIPAITFRELTRVKNSTRSYKHYFIVAGFSLLFLMSYYFMWVPGSCVATYWKLNTFSVTLEVTLATNVFSLFTIFYLRICGLPVTSRLIFELDVSNKWYFSIITDILLVVINSNVRNLYVQKIFGIQTF